MCWRASAMEWYHIFFFAIYFMLIISWLYEAMKRG